jgi:hypothetical protein
MPSRSWKSWWTTLISFHQELIRVVQQKLEGQILIMWSHKFGSNPGCCFSDGRSLGADRPAAAAHRPSGGTMEEVAGVVLAYTTGHGSWFGLVLRCCNVKGIPFSLTLSHGDDEGGRATAGFIVHPKTASGARSIGPLAPGRCRMAATWPPLARSRVGKLWGGSWRRGDNSEL